MRQRALFATLVLLNAAVLAVPLAPAATPGAPEPALPPAPAPAAADVEVPTQAPAQLHVLLAGERGGVTATLRWSTVPSLVAGTLALSPAGGLSLADAGALALGPEDVAGVRAVALETEGDGPFTLHATLDAVLAHHVYSTSRAATFHFDGEGRLVLGHPDAGKAEVEDVAAPGDGVVPAREEGPVAQTHCTTSFTVNYKTSSGASIPSGKQNVPVRGIEVNARDASNTILQTRYTNANGDASFSITTDPCNNSFNFLRQMIYKDGATEKIRGANLGGGLYTGTFTPGSPITNGQTVFIAVSEAHTGSAYMHGQFVESYDETKASGYTITRAVTHRWTQDQHRAPGCTTCYEGGSPGTIYMNGTDEDEFSDWETYHEYGHHMHFDAAGGTLPGSSYGDHTNCTGCHYWDSAHGAPGSAFKEAWANFYAGLIKDTASIIIGDLENPNTGRGDHTSLNNWGPFREGAIAGALWDAKKGAGVTNGDFYETLQQNPADIYRFYEDWIALGQPAQSTFASSMENLGIAARGDGDSWVDAAESQPGQGISTGSNDGDLTYEPHQATEDRKDFLSFSATSGQAITFTMTPPSISDLDLYLYNPSGTLKASSTAGTGSVDTVSFTADATGTWRVEVRQFSTSEGGRYTYTLTIGTVQDLTGTTITSIPSTVNPGQVFSVCFSVSGSGTISHAQLHYGTSSGSHPFSTTVRSGSAPNSWCESITAPSSGSYYFVSHATGPNDPNLQSTERRVDVVPPNDLTSVTITSAPATVLPLASFTVCWQVNGSGTISHTHLHHGTASGSYPSSTTVRTGTAPQSWCETLTAPASGSVYIRAHATGPNDNLLSSEHRVGVLI